MAQYTLQNDWYAPDGTYFPASRVDGVEIPAHLVKHLPKNSAKLYDPASAAQVRGIIPPMMNLDTRGVGRVTTQDVFAAQQEAPVSRETVAPVQPVLTADAAVAIAAASQSAEAVQAAQPEPAKKPGRRS